MKKEKKATKETVTWKAVGRKVVILPKPQDKEGKTESGIYIPDTTKKDPLAEGTVISVGDKVEAVEEGDYAYFSPLAYEELPGGVVVVDENDIFAVQ